MPKDTRREPAARYRACGKNMYNTDPKAPNICYQCRKKRAS